MKKQHLFKITAILLTLCICISLLPASAIALEAEDTSPDTAINLSDIFGGFVDPAELYDPLDKDTVPDIIGYDDAVSRNHIQRLYADEGSDLNKIVFLNIDGTKTMYNFDFPVKFVNENGDIQDITLEIADSNTEQAKYETASNSAVTTFSARLSDGIALSGNGTDIKLVPILPDTVTGLATASVDSNAESSILQEAQRIDENTIEYPYDINTTIEYSLTYTGFKEDIVVSEYTGQTEYEFTLYTHGYALTEIDGSYYLVDDTGKIKASIGDIIIFTADNRNNTFGHIVPTTIVEKQEYLLTIVVDEAFLSDENTVYPIRIDPTVEINYDNNGAGAIEDININSQSTASGSSGSLYIGLRQSQGISRVLMKFPGLNLSSLGSNVEIQTATVTLRDLMCESTALSIDCHVFAGNSWSEDSATWSNVSPNSYSTLLSSLTMSYSTGAALSPIHRYSFDITRAVQGWIDGNYTQSKGIIFKVSSSIENGSTYNHRTVGSYNRSSYKPTLSVTYTTGNAGTIANGTYYLNNMYCGQYLRYTSSNGVTTSSGLLSSLGTSIQWQLQKVSGGYVIRSVSNPIYYLGVPTNTSSNTAEIVTVNNTAIPSRCIWTIPAASGGGGLLKNTYNARYLYASGSSLYTSTSYGTVGSSAYDIYVWRIGSTSDYGNTSSYVRRELSYFTVNDLVVNVGATKTPTINKSPTNYAWAGSRDFKFTRISGTSGAADFAYPTSVCTGRKIGIAKYTAIHKVTNRAYTFTVYVDRFTYELVNEFGFINNDALLIRGFYDRIDEVYPGESTLMRAWRASRLLGGIVYGSDPNASPDNTIEAIKWADVAGLVFVGSEQNYFVSTLGYSETDYTQLKESIEENYINTNTSDFAHMQISLSARLAYQLDKDGFFANIGTFCSDEDISYLAGWLGDATLTNDDGDTTFGNDDYHADLDAENVFRLIQQGKSTVNAINEYYSSLTSSNTRADTFLTHINYQTIEGKILNELDCDIDTIETTYPDTYNFLCSIQYGLSDIGSY